MNLRTLEAIGKELRTELTRRRFGKIFQLGRARFVFDLRPGGTRYLFADAAPPEPAVYLVDRRLRDLERSSQNLSAFALQLRKATSGAEITLVETVAGERVLIVTTSGRDDFGTETKHRIVFQMTGRSANLFITDRNGIIIDRLRDNAGDGQQIGEPYSPPVRGEIGPERESGADTAVAADPENPSAALDQYFSELEAGRAFESLARSAAARISAAIRKREKLVGNLEEDLTGHGNAEEWKRLGDLLLSNASNARRENGNLFVIDYFDEDLAEVAIPAEENDSVTETAEKCYRRYTKARNAAFEVSSRLAKLHGELDSLAHEKARLEKAIEEKDSAALEEFLGESPQSRTATRGKKPTETASGTRRFISSDGFEILVGKKAKDNDQLTFKVAKSLDTWMHAADYPGSHVVVRNPNRVDIPPRTLHEAAQIAAFYSQGKAQTKAAVHYTQKKFVNKPKGAAPGLVSLASFKTLLVVPEFPDGVEKLDT